MHINGARQRLTPSPQTVHDVHQSPECLLSPSVWHRNEVWHGNCTRTNYSWYCLETMLRLKRSAWFEDHMVVLKRAARRKQPSVLLKRSVEVWEAAPEAKRCPVRLQWWSSLGAPVRLHAQYFFSIIDHDDIHNVKRLKARSMETERAKRPRFQMCGAQEETNWFSSIYLSQVAVRSFQQYRCTREIDDCTIISHLSIVKRSAFGTDVSGSIVGYGCCLLPPACMSPSCRATSTTIFGEESPVGVL